MPLISRAKATEAQQQLTFLHSLEKSYFYTYSRYSNDLEELGFEQATLVTDGGNANYRIEVVEAGENGFKAQAVSVVDFDKDGVFNVWEIDQDKNLKETVKDWCDVEVAFHIPAYGYDGLGCEKPHGFLLVAVGFVMIAMYLPMFKLGMTIS